MLALTRDYAAQARTASGINILLGIWLIVSPWVFDYSGRAPVLNSVNVGALISILAAFRLGTLDRSAGLSAINLILGLWTIASPWVCDFSANVGAEQEHAAPCNGELPWLLTARLQGRSSRRNGGSGGRPHSWPIPHRRRTPASGIKTNSCEVVAHGRRRTGDSRECTLVNQ